MKTVAIIAEYNPFHKGHIYHLNKALEITDADCSVAIIGGNFLQRGQAAMWDKYTRAAMCLSSGIDLALELPFPYATGSAMDFSMGAIGILENLGSIDYLCFGAENADINVLSEIAEIFVNEPSQYKTFLKNNLSEGMSYPLAREKAIISYTGNEDYISIISSPNNILAIEYICALKKHNSSIKPVVIQRIQSGYHDTKLNNDISSATAIRHFFETNKEIISETDIFNEIKSGISEEVFTIIKKTYAKTAPIYTNSLTPLLQSKLISHGDLSNICDLSPETANKLASLNLCNSYSEIIKELKTKDVTHSRIARSLIHLLLDYTDEDRNTFINDGYAYYANILGFKKASSKLIKNIHETSRIPIITKKADFIKYFDEYPDIRLDNAKKMWQLDTRATMLYNYLIYNTYGTKHNNDFNINLPII